MNNLTTSPYSKKNNTKSVTYVVRSNDTKLQPETGLEDSPSSPAVSEQPHTTTRSLAGTDGSSSRNRTNPKKINSFFKNSQKFILDLRCEVSKYSLDTDTAQEEFTKLLAYNLPKIDRIIKASKQLCVEWSDVDAIGMSMPTDKFGAIDYGTQNYGLHNAVNAQKMAKIISSLKSLYTEIEEQVGSTEQENGTPLSSDAIARKYPGLLARRTLIRELETLRQDHVDIFGKKSRATAVEKKTHLYASTFNKAVVMARTSERRTERDHHSIFKNILVTGKDNGLYTAEYLNRYLDDKARLPAKVLKELISEYKEYIEKPTTSEGKTPLESTAYNKFCKFHRLEKNFETGEKTYAIGTRENTLINSLKGFGFTTQEIKSCFSSDPSVEKSHDTIIDRLKEFEAMEEKSIELLPDYGTIKKSITEAKDDLSNTKKLAHGLRLLAQMGTAKHKNKMFRHFKRELPATSYANRQLIIDKLKLCLEHGVLDLKNSFILSDKKVQKLKIPTDKSKAKTYLETLDNSDLDVLLKHAVDSVKELQSKFSYRGKLMFHEESLNFLTEAYKKDEIKVTGESAAVTPIDHKEAKEFYAKNTAYHKKVQHYHSWSENLLRKKFINRADSVIGTISYTAKEAWRSISLGAILLGTAAYHIPAAFIKSGKGRVIEDKDDIKTVGKYRKLYNLDPLTTISKQDLNRAKYGETRLKIGWGKTISSLDKRFSKAAKYHPQAGEAAIIGDGAGAAVSDQMALVNNSPNAGNLANDWFVASDAFNGLFQYSFVGTKFRAFIKRNKEAREQFDNRRLAIKNSAKVIHSQMQKKNPVDFRDTLIQAMAELSDLNASGDENLVVNKEDRELLRRKKGLPLESNYSFSELRRKSQGGRYFISLSKMAKGMNAAVDQTAFLRYSAMGPFTWTRAGFTGSVAANMQPKVSSGLGFFVGGVWGTLLLGTKMSADSIQRRGESINLNKDKKARDSESYKDALKKDPVFKMNSDGAKAAFMKNRTIPGHELGMGWTWEGVFTSVTIYTGMSFMYKYGVGVGISIATSAALLWGGVAGLSVVGLGYNLWARRRAKSKLHFKQASHEAILNGGKLDAAKGCRYRKAMSRISKTWPLKMVMPHKMMATSKKNIFIANMDPKYNDWNITEDAPNKDLFLDALADIIHKQFKAIKETGVPLDVDTLMTSIMNTTDAQLRRDIVINQQLLKDLIDSETITQDSSLSDIQDKLKAALKATQDDGDQLQIVQPLDTDYKMRATAIINQRRDDIDLTIGQLVDAVRQEMQLTDKEKDSLQNDGELRRKEKDDLKKINETASDFKSAADGAFYESKFSTRMKYLVGGTDKASEENTSALSLSKTEAISQKMFEFTHRGKVDDNRFERSPTAKYMLEMQVPKVVVQAIADSSPTQANNAAALKALKVHFMQVSIPSDKYSHHIEEDGLYHTSGEKDSTPAANYP